MNDHWKDVVDKLYCTLELERCAVGVKILKSEEEYENLQGGMILSRPINYCQMVAAATRGNALKVKMENFKCQSGPRVLGMSQDDPKNNHGENWARLGLYKDEQLSRIVRDGLTYSKEKIFGVFLAPIEQMCNKPDVIIIATTPYNSMRLIQGYAYSYGMPKAINMIGNQALCLECTARPYTIKDMNVSMLCIGTRHRAGWKDDEMAIGIPIEQFEDVVLGLINTLNLMENDANKKNIEDKLKEKKIPFDIRYGYNYYMDCK